MSRGIFIKADNCTRYKVTALFESNLSVKEISSIFDLLGFSMIKLEQEHINEKGEVKIINAWAQEKQ
jgi:hypothetical protein